MTSGLFWCPDFVALGWGRGRLRPCASGWAQEAKMLASAGWGLENRSKGKVFRAGGSLSVRVQGAQECGPKIGLKGKGWGLPGSGIGLRDFGLGEGGSRAQARRWGMPEIGFRTRIFRLEAYGLKRKARGGGGKPLEALFCPPACET